MREVRVYALLLVSAIAGGCAQAGSGFSPADDVAEANNTPLQTSDKEDATTPNNEDTAVPPSEDTAATSNEDAATSDEDIPSTQNEDVTASVDTKTPVDEDTKVVAPARYLGGWSKADCADQIQATGTKKGDIAKDFSQMDQFGETLRLYDFCDRTVLLTGAAFW